MSPLSLSRAINAFWKPWARPDIQWVAGDASLLHLGPTLVGAETEYKANLNITLVMEANLKGGGGFAYALNQIIVPKKQQ